MDRLIDDAMRPLADAASAFVFYSVPLFGADVPLIVLWLVAGGVFFTGYLTALVIITTIYDPALANQDVSGVELTARAFASTLPFSSVPLAIAAVLFAFSTMIAWAYYGLKAFTYLAGEGRARDLSFKAFYCMSVVVGSSITLGALVDLSDALIFIVAIPNLMGLYLMAPVVKRELERYRPELTQSKGS